MYSSGSGPQWPSRWCQISAGVVVFFSFFFFSFWEIKIWFGDIIFLFISTSSGCKSFDLSGNSI
jgi:hypothetical protein